MQRNKDGNFRYIDCKKLVDECIHRRLLFGEIGSYIMVYRNGTCSCPPGFHKDDYEQVIQELMRDEEGIAFLTKALEKVRNNEKIIL